MFLQTFWEKLRFTILNYIYLIILCIVNLKKYMFCTINYDICYTLYSNAKLKEKLHFITMNYTFYYTLHHKLWISIQVNIKLNIRVQSITNIIVYDTKREFKSLDCKM